MKTPLLILALLCTFCIARAAAAEPNVTVTVAPMESSALIYAPMGAINGTTPGAAVNSKHMTCQAIDLHDADGEVDDWLMTTIGQAMLRDIGLWHEHPAATKGWAHVQTVPPRSGRRTFYP